ncbi:MAG: preprotein translocase subunit SecG [Clostridiales bacterium]|nr:preprotein translocase subunit SecG [Clostridiales bacterium]MBO4579000.1 preprotein translocase subunit SecG [Clostridiales bacterium]
MSVVNIILSAIDAVLALAIIVLFLVQEGNDHGIGVVAGSSASNDSYYSKIKGKSREMQLKKWTVICSVLFAIISVVLYLSLARNW